jgi:hypothetical protein
MIVPKFYYHLTQHKWPKEITLIPKIEGDHRACDEPEISRTCVSPTIEGCLVALGCCLGKSNITYIYCTKNKVLAKNPYRVADSSITKEKWLIKPIKFERIGIINKLLPQELYYLGVGGYSNQDEQISMLKKLKKMNLSFVDWI